MSLNEFLVLILGISCMNGQESISCGETINGYREETQEVPLTFTALNDYSLVFLEGCRSTHDIWLEILNSNDKSIADADDRNDHGVNQSECGNQYAGDITIPGEVKRGEQYTFIIKGYKNRYGYYSVSLVCQSQYADKTTTSASPTQIIATTPSPTQDNHDNNNECLRIRKPWHLLTQQQRDLYINGWMELNRNGKLEVFTETHGNSDIDKHGNAVFLPWHRLFIWELESQFRELGDDWECFGLPYWDWSYDIEQSGWNVEDWQILNSGLGGAGNKDNNYCVDNDGWDSYIPSTSTGNGNDGVPCLRRKICEESATTSCSFLGQASKLHSLLSEERYYGDDDRDLDYRYRLELKHGSAHVRIGGSYDDEGGHLGLLSKSTDDPIFYLIHSFVDFQYSLWQDCRDHELVNKDSITTAMYNGDIYELDDELEFGALENQHWSYIGNYNEITVRDMHSIQDWNVIYDKGDYFIRAKVEDDASICRDTINPLWFTEDDDTRRRLKENNKYASDNEEYSHDVFDRIRTKYGCQKSSSTEQKTELFMTWAQMDCQFLNIGKNCGRPKYFDDCSDMELDRYVPGTGTYDIDITLDELIEKVEDYECMVETRERYYEWAKQVGNLKGLARGDYDTFCDHGFVSKQPSEQKCVANQDKKRGHKGKEKGGYQW